MAAEVNAVELMVRLVASLGMVVAIILVIARAVRNRGGIGLGRSAKGPKLDVLDRTSLSRSASVAVVRVGGRGLIVGITDHTVTLLAEAPELIDRYEMVGQEAPGGDQNLNDELTVEAERTAPPVEMVVGGPPTADAPKSARMNFFDALRESTVRRS